MNDWRTFDVTLSLEGIDTITDEVEKAVCELGGTLSSRGGRVLVTFKATYCWREYPRAEVPKRKGKE